MSSPLPIFLRSLYFLLCLPVLSGLTVFPHTAQAATTAPAEIGRVISVTPAAWAQRNGARTNLALKAPLFKTDSVQTDASGKVQILFADETTVSVAPSTLVHLEDFAFDEHQASFGMRMSQGVSRVVTGKIVKANPEGFIVTTPQATVGIRGTDCTIIADGAKTIVVANRITHNDIRVTNVATGQIANISKSGMAVESTAGGNIARPATNQERTQATQAMRKSGTQSTAANAQGTAQETATTAQTTETTAQGTITTTQNTSASTQSIAISTQSAKANPQIIDPQLPPTLDFPSLPPVITPTPPSSISGTYIGRVDSTGQSGSFQFNVALFSGSISNAEMLLFNKDATNTLFLNAYDGTGSIGSDRNFSVDSWTVSEDSVASNPTLNGIFASNNNSLTDITWGAIANDGSSVSGTGVSTGHSQTPSGDMLNPNNISGNFSGSLHNSNGSLSGNYGFTVGLGSGRISDASMSMANLVTATGGTGAISAGRDFNVNQWSNITGVATGSGSVPTLGGQFNLNGDLSSVHWNVKDSSGNIITYNPGSPNEIPLTGTGTPSPAKP